MLLERSLVDRPSWKAFWWSRNFPASAIASSCCMPARCWAPKTGHALILLGFEDITERRAIEQEKAVLQERTDDLLKQKEMLLAEMQHRIVNSLQIIASILMLKARAVTSEETRQHLQDAHRRVMSVAAVQQHLHSSGRADVIEIAPYLAKLCSSLAESMIGESRPATITVDGRQGLRSVSRRRQPGPDRHRTGDQRPEIRLSRSRAKQATVTVRYEVNGTDWKLSVIRQWRGTHRGQRTARKGRPGHQPGQGAGAPAGRQGGDRQQPVGHDHFDHPRDLPLPHSGLVCAHAPFTLRRM